MRRARWVHFRLTSSRCQRSRVWGVTIKDAHRALGSALATEASSVRSVARSLGRPTRRRSTLSWCRSTRISMSLDPSSPERARRRASAWAIRERTNSIRACYEMDDRKANRLLDPHRGRAGVYLRAELLHQPQVVAMVPEFHDLAVADPEDVYARERGARTRKKHYQLVGPVQQPRRSTESLLSPWSASNRSCPAPPTTSSFPSTWSLTFRQVSAPRSPSTRSKPSPPRAKSAPPPAWSRSLPALPASPSEPGPAQPKSGPGPARTTSSPRFPKIVSCPAPPRIVSSPLPPRSRSSPPLPKIRSSPPRPQITSGPGPPLSVSPSGVPWSEQPAGAPIAPDADTTIDTSSPNVATTPPTRALTLRRVTCSRRIRPKSRSQHR